MLAGIGNGRMACSPSPANEKAMMMRNCLSSRIA